MELSKENIQNKILPSLFYEKDGRRILEEVKSCLSNNSLTLNKIKQDFNELLEIKDERFWGSFIKIFNQSFSCNLELKNYNLKNNFEEFINDLMRIKFDFIFKENDNKRIQDEILLNKYIKDLEKKENVISITSKDNIKRIIVPFETEYFANALPNQPQKLKQYPNLLLKVEGNKISFNASDSKRICGIISNIESNKGKDGSILTDFNKDHFEKFDLDIKNYFTNLKDEGFCIKNIKFSNSLFYFNVGSKMIWDIERLINSDFYLNTPLDFICINQLKLVYNAEVEGKNKDVFILLTATIQDINENIKSVKFKLSFSKPKNLSESIKKEILSKFDNLGLKFEIAYDLPIEYYLNQLFNPDTNLPRLYKKIMEINPDNKLIKELLAQKVIIISDEDIKLDHKKLNDFFIKSFNKIKGKIYYSKLRNKSFCINEIFKDSKGRVRLKIKIFRDEDQKINEYHEVIIDNDVRGYDKILKIIFYNFDQAFLLNSISENKIDGALEYISLKADNYMQYEYNIQLEKEANACHKWLIEYCNNFKEWEKSQDPKKLGNKVEQKLNILLKFIFRNYFLIGGSRKPDGYLYISSTDNSFLIDSKQHKNILIGEIDKVVRYLLGFTKEDNLPEAKTGILIICRGKLGDSLNKDAKDKWKESSEFGKGFDIGFISLEFLLKLFEFSKSSVLNSNSKLKNKIYESFEEIISKSKNLSNKDKLISIEQSKITNLQNLTNEEKYLPRRKEQL